MKPQFRFTVSPQVFELLPTACFATITITGADNSNEIAEIATLLSQEISRQEQALAGANVKELPAIVPYREAFRTLGINPNKFMCSIEALLSRIAKQKGFPSINPVVNLANAISIKYSLPIGAHDLATIDESLAVRLAEKEDTFIAFGSDEVEVPETDELLYVAGHNIRTRRWIWRQSEIGKITPQSQDVFFPIDGFSDINKEQVLLAQKELAQLLEDYFQIKPVLGFVNKDNPTFILN